MIKLNFAKIELVRGVKINIFYLKLMLSELKFSQSTVHFVMKKIKTREQNVK